MTDKIEYTAYNETVTLSNYYEKDQERRDEEGLVAYPVGRRSEMKDSYMNMKEKSLDRFRNEIPLGSKVRLKARSRATEYTFVEMAEVDGMLTVALLDDHFEIHFLISTKDVKNAADALFDENMYLVNGWGNKTRTIDGYDPHEEFWEVPWTGIRERREKEEAERIAERTAIFEALPTTIAVERERTSIQSISCMERVYGQGGSPVSLTSKVYDIPYPDGTGTEERQERFITMWKEEGDYPTYFLVTKFEGELLAYELRVGFSGSDRKFKQITDGRESQRVGWRTERFDDVEDTLPGETATVDRGYHDCEWIRMTGEMIATDPNIMGRISVEYDSEPHVNRIRDQRRLEEQERRRREREERDAASIRETGPGGIRVGDPVAAKGDRYGRVTKIYDERVQFASRDGKWKYDVDFDDIIPLNDSQKDEFEKEEEKIRKEAEFQDTLDNAKLDLSDPIQFAAYEYREAMRLLDAREVPREADERRLSLATRMRRTLTESAKQQKEKVKSQ